MNDSNDNESLKAQLSALRPPEHPAAMASPLVLAYIGDAVYELAVRIRLVEQSPSAPVGRLHRRAADWVRASAQAQLMDQLGDLLTETEQAIVRRARNTKANVPRSATVFEYRYSTAFEALLGHLFLAGELDRLLYLLDKVLPKGELQS